MKSDEQDVSTSLLPRQTYSPIERPTDCGIEGVVFCALSRIRYRFDGGGVGLVGQILGLQKNLKPFWTLVPGAQTKHAVRICSERVGFVHGVVGHVPFDVGRDIQALGQSLRAALLDARKSDRNRRRSTGP